MELSAKNIVMLRNGNIGVVVGWGGKPTYVVTATFVNTTDRWGENGKRNAKSAEPNKYDIMEIRDGSSVEKATDVFKSSFDASALPLVWKAEA